MRQGFGGMLSAIPSTESTPPLYYALAWLWAKVFGAGEAGLRSFSAVLGVATIPVVWLTARELFSERAALVAAALAAVNPYLVWYSQEARSYSLLAFLCALSLLLFARALREPRGRTFAAWAGVAVLAVLTHYFAVFLLIPEIGWLVYATRRRAALAAAGALAAACGLLAPLALHQRGSGHTTFISQLGNRRIVDIPKKLVTGELGSPLPLLGPAAGLLVVAAIAYGVARSEPRWRRNQLVLLGLAAATLAIPLAIKLAGADYVLARNVIALYVPLILAAAGGLGLARAGRVGVLGAVALCAAALVVNVQVAYNSKLERDDWRGAARALGPPIQTRAVVVTSAPQAKPLQLYAGEMQVLPTWGATVGEVDVVGNARPPRFAEPPQPSGFRGVYRKITPSYELIRYVSPRPVTVTRAELARSRLGAKPAAILLQSPGRR